MYSPKNNKSVTIRDVALRSECSTSTVSNVLNRTGRVGRILRARVLRVAEELGYSAAPSGRSLRIGRMETVGMLFYPSCSWLFRNTFYTHVLEALEGELSKHRYSLLLAGFKSYSDISIHRLRQCMDGVILAGSFPAEVTRRLYSIQKNLVTLDYCEDLPISSIVSDGVLSSRLVVAHLASLGHKRILMVAYSSHDYNTDMRIRGFSQAIEEYTDLQKEGVILRKYATTDETVQNVMDILKSPNPPTAIYSVNDTMALAIQTACKEAGLRLPEEVSLVGFNDDDFARTMKPALTTVRVDREQLGQLCADLIIRRIITPNAPTATLRLTTRLIIRESTHPPERAPIT